VPVDRGEVVVLVNGTELLAVGVPPVVPDGAGGGVLLRCEHKRGASTRYLAYLIPLIVPPGRLVLGMPEICCRTVSLKVPLIPSRLRPVSVVLSERCPVVIPEEPRE
jgi:hypothetical protein